MPFDDQVLAELRETHKRLETQDKLLSRSQLNKYYDTFRRRFGPDALQARDGVLLLEYMHDTGNKDSLVYWLEFKNDDEFPAAFGSIAGGSALKFGIFRKKKTGTWMKGPPLAPSEIDDDEAVEIARRNREQMIKGVAILEAFPASAQDDSAYLHLQNELCRAAPDVANTAWGHKYFALLFPEIIDDCHVPNYQRFQLIRNLILPPAQEGRYACAGRFAELARVMGIPNTTATTVMKARNGNPFSYWRIGTSDGSTPRNEWEPMREGSYIAVGWPLLSDLSFVESTSASREQLRDILGRHYPGKPSTVGKQTMQLFRFLTSVKENDIVVACDGARVLGVLSKDICPENSL